MPALALTVRPGAHEYWQARVAGPAGAPAWVEFAPVAAGTSGRVSMLPPVQVPVGRAQPPWPTPAECYLAALAPATRISINGSEAGPEDTAEIIATVADSLMAVGALPGQLLAVAARQRGPREPADHREHPVGSRLGRDRPAAVTVTGPRRSRPRARRGRASATRRSPVRPAARRPPPPGAASRAASRRIRAW
jgi:hypothetical protein